MLAEREDLAIQTVQANMTQMFPFEDNSFDIIFNPVSNIFIEELTPCGMSLLSTETWWNTNISRKLEREGRLRIDPKQGYEFSHSLDSQIGG